MSGSVKSIRHHQSFAGRDVDDAHAQYLLASCGSLDDWDAGYAHSLVTSGNPHSVDFDELTGSMAHADLTGRDAVDAHTQYLRLAETAEQVLSGNLNMSGFSIRDVGHIVGSDEASLYLDSCRYIHLTACDGVNIWVDCDLVLAICSDNVSVHGCLCVTDDLDVCGSINGCEAYITCLEACGLEVTSTEDQVLAYFTNECECCGDGNQDGGFRAFYGLRNECATCSNWSHYNIVKRSDCVDVTLKGYFKINVNGYDRWVKFYQDC